MGRSQSKIGRGSRHASPPKDPYPTDRTSDNGGGGAIISNYYGRKTNSSFISEPEQQAIVPPLPLNQRKRSRSPTKNKPTMPSMD